MTDTDPAPACLPPDFAVSYCTIRDSIVARLQDFKTVWECGDEIDIWPELVFCLLTPQSSAVRCWSAVGELSARGLLMEGSAEEIASVLARKTRFHNNKALHVVRAREMFFTGDPPAPAIREILIEMGIENNARKTRDRLALVVKGMGLKEASHFLRNVGWGAHLAILDRHILKNMVCLGIMNKVPDHLSPRVYHELEGKLEEYCTNIGVPMDHIDLLLWYMQAGHVFK